MISIFRQYATKNFVFNVLLVKYMNVLTKLHTGWKNIYTLFRKNFAMHFFQHKSFPCNNLSKILQ